MVRILSICCLRNPTNYSNIVSALNEHATVHFKLSSDNKSGAGTDLKINEMSTIHVSALATYEIQVQIASSLSWLSAAFRRSSHVKVMYSSTLVKAKTLGSGKDGIALFPKPLESSPSRNSCWHSLFPNGTIARGFPIRPRKEGIGLEILFADMVVASKCLSFVEYEGSLIVHGLRNVLIPIGELSKDDALQWHLEDRTKQDGYGLARISQILRLHNFSPYKALKPEMLVRRRCFLGWAERGNVVIGTKGYQTNFERSRAPNAPVQGHIKSHSFTIGSGIFGWFTASGTLVRTPVSVPAYISTSIEKDIYDILATSKDHYVLVYDNMLHIGWYVPKASFVLQMAFSIIIGREYELYNGENKISLDNDFSFARLSPDGATEASLALKQNIRFKVRKHTLGKEPIEEPFSKTIEMIWHTLSDIETGLESAKSDLQRAGYTTPKYLHGVDLTDVGNTEHSIRIKQVQVNQSWTRLTSEEPIAILTRNLQDAIVPECEMLCGNWSTAPTYSNYLVAGGRAAFSFLNRREHGLADRLEWEARPECLVQFHRYGQRTQVIHSQRLRSMRKPNPNKFIRKAVGEYLDGCFVFGDSSQNECSEVLEKPELKLLDRIRPPALYQLNKKQLSRPSSASDTSANSEDSMATSLTHESSLASSHPENFEPHPFGIESSNSRSYTPSA
jgi:hypothetical protein